MDTRKGQLKELLKAARARVDPTEVGLGEAIRRKSPGLRREDVAVLAGVSLKWYTWLEQGRDVNFSADVLERVSTALRLSASERHYLLALMRRQVSTLVSRDNRITPALWRMVQYVPVPALVITRRWDIVTWNCRTTRVFRDYSLIPQSERNLLRIILTDEKYQSDPRVFEHICRKLLGEFRVDFGRCAGDPAFEELVAELMRVVPDFERHWKEVEIHEEKGGTVVQHDELGELCFDRISYVPEDTPSFRVLMYIPCEPRTAGIIAALPALAPELAPLSLVTENAAEPYVLRHTNRH
jgi:transcriptional regulator with XRE-family HTH domain